MNCTRGGHHQRHLPGARQVAAVLPVAMTEMHRSVLVERVEGMVAGAGAAGMGDVVIIGEEGIAGEAEDVGMVEGVVTVVEDVGMVVVVDSVHHSHPPPHHLHPVTMRVDRMIGVHRLVMVWVIIAEGPLEGTVSVVQGHRKVVVDEEKGAVVEGVGQWVMEGVVVSLDLALAPVQGPGKGEGEVMILLGIGCVVEVGVGVGVVVVVEEGGERPGEEEEEEEGVVVVTDLFHLVGVVFVEEGTEEEVGVEGDEMGVEGVEGEVVADTS